MSLVNPRDPSSNHSRVQNRIFHTRKKSDFCTEERTGKELARKTEANLQNEAGFTNAVCSVLRLTEGSLSA